MKNTRRIPILIMGILILAAFACNFPFVAAPTPIVFPTPDLTMTAVFNPTQPTAPIGFPTLTLPPPLESPVPTESQAPPSPWPTATATPLPPTPIPTRTPTATISYAGPDKRPKFSMNAYYFSTSPTIDANLEDWNLDRYLVESVVFGKSKHTGPGDLSGRAMIGWDDKNLYLGIRVIDDEYVQNAKGANLYKGDSLDILLDTDVPSDFYLGALNGDDYQLGISPGSPAPNESPEAYLWFPKSIEGKRDTLDIAARTKDDGYVVEAAVPWSVFDVSPKSGQHFGFVFSISDNDNSSNNVQQSMVSFVPIRTLTDPTTWGDLTLVK